MSAVQVSFFCLNPLILHPNGSSYTSGAPDFFATRGFTTCIASRPGCESPARDVPPSKKGPVLLLSHSLCAELEHEVGSNFLSLAPKPFTVFFYSKGSALVPPTPFLGGGAGRPEAGQGLL